MNFRKKISILGCLMIFLIIFFACAKHPIITLKRIIAQPEIDFKIIKRVAILESTPNPQVKKDRNITDLIEDEFRKKGYYVIGVNRFNSVLEELGFSIEDLSNPDILNSVAEELNISAIISGIVKKYEIIRVEDYMKETKIDSHAIIDGGAAARVDIIYICDIHLVIEMIEAKKGNKIWSCSISYSKEIRKPEKLIRNMIRNSLNTIPHE